MEQMNSAAPANSAQNTRILNPCVDDIIEIANRVRAEVHPDDVDRVFNAIIRSIYPPAD